MFGQESRKNQRTSELVLNLAHIILGIVIVILAVLAFINPQENLICFPLIFFLASGLNVLNGCHRIRTANRTKKHRFAGISQIVFGLFLFALGVVSIISIQWR